MSCDVLLWTAGEVLGAGSDKVYSRAREFGELCGMVGKHWVRMWVESMAGVHL